MSGLGALHTLAIDEDLVALHLDQHRAVTALPDEGLDTIGGQRQRELEAIGAVAPLGAAWVRITEVVGLMKRRAQNQSHSCRSHSGKRSGLG